MNDLFKSVVSHPIAVVMVAIAATVFGVVSYNRLPVELMPDLSYPTLTVRTTYEGAAPAEMEAQISRPIEEGLATLDGLRTLQSRSRAGASDVILGFDWGTDMAKASQTVRESLQTNFMPDEADRPLLLHFDPSLDPILRIALSTTAEGEDLTKALAVLREIGENEVKRELEAMDGVAAVRIRGGLERELRVEVREDWLAGHGITLDQVQTALAQENVNLAGGSILQGDTEYLVRTLNEYTTIAELEQLGIRRSDGKIVQLNQVATVVPTVREAQVVARMDGSPAVELEVFRTADSNIVDVADRVKRSLLDEEDGLVSDLPDGVSARILDDQAEFIVHSIDNLTNTAILGGFLAIGILFLFLRNFRATAIIGTAIPVSIVAAFAPLYLGGVSLNLMSLGGLALGIGMLVDNAVVVLESIQRYLDEGKAPREASVLGASDVATAVTASTLTTVAVFLPIAFVEGVAGQLFGDLAIAVVASLVASLVVALFLVPTLAGWRYQPMGSTVLNGAQGVVAGQSRVRRSLAYVFAESFAMFKADMSWCRASVLRWPAAPWMLARFAFRMALRTITVFFAGLSVFGGFAFVAFYRLIIKRLMGLALWVASGFEGIYQIGARRYEAVLGRTLGRATGVIVLGVVVFLLAVFLGRGLGTELIPEVHQGRFTVEASLPVGTPLSVTDSRARLAERLIAEHPDIASVYTSVGADIRADANADEGPHSARFRINLTPGGDLQTREDLVARQLRSRLQTQIPEFELRIVRPSLFSVQTPLEVIVTGWDLAQLRAAGDDVVVRMQSVEGLKDVQSSLVAGHPEILVKYDRQRLRRFGLDPATVAGRVRDKVQGTIATRIRQQDERVDLRVQLTERDRASLQDLRSININPNLIPPIPLDVVADVIEEEGPSEIRRVDQQRAVVVGANVEGFDLGSAAGRVEDSLAGLSLAEDMTWEVGGQSTEMEASLSSLQFALLLAVFLVYVIMASTFESIVQPFVILLSVPLAAIGVVGALGLFGLPISVVVLIGMIVLAGVVVNNAIVLVDTINRQRTAGMDRFAAVHAGASMRLRPILITTATTVLGLFPLALGLGAGSEIQQPLAVTIIGGLLSSTLLTLVVIPSLYLVITRDPTPDVEAPAK